MTAEVDLFQLAAEARPLIQQLHQREDVVVQFKSDASSYDFDKLSADERAEVDHPGKFTLANKFLTINLDPLISDRRPMPTKLDSLEDFRAHPVFAGVVAHSAAHARFSIWDQDPSKVPSELPNPDFDPEHPFPETDFSIEEADGSITVEQHADDKYRGPESFPVSNQGRLMEVAAMLEEARTERVAMRTFGRTWREALKYSSTHLTLESLDEGDEVGESALDSALRTMILIGGRTVAGTLGFDPRNRTATQKVLANSQKVIETALAEQINEGGDPFHEAMSIISDAVFDNSHEEVIPHLEFARRILNIIHPEDAENPDNPGAGAGGGGQGAATGAMAMAKGSAPGEKPEKPEDDEGSHDGEGEGEVSGNPGMSEEMKKALEEAAAELAEAMNELANEAAEATANEEKRVDEEIDEGADGFGAVSSKNEKPPHIDRYETPSKDDRALAKKAEEWMRAQIEPTITEFERGQWMPGGGSRFNARNYVRDNLSGRQGTERTDWEKTDEMVKQAPPVKVGIMLDGSGSMRSKARESGGIAYAIAAASASLPESRTASLVFGHDALLTQAAGHGIIPKEVAVAKNSSGWENFSAGAKMIEEELQLGAENFEDGDPTNTLIIIVSDLMFGGGPNQGVKPQGFEFTKKTREWAERGFRVVIVGARPYGPENYGVKMDNVELVDVKDLFV